MAKYLDSAGVKYLWQKIRKADDLTLTSIENTYQKKVSASGNANRPLYVNSEGEFTVCNVFAGGTEVTLNGYNKGSAVASFYAPTSAGANGQVLTSTGGSPSWVSPSTLHVSYADSCDEATWASSADEAGSATTDSDGNKISTTYVKKSSIGQASGIAPLDSTGKIASSYLPSYVDDVLEYTNRGSFPTIGETGKIYINISDGKTYRWSGSTYSEISASLALGETSSTAYAGDKGKANANAIAALQSGKLDKSGGTITGDLTAQGQLIIDNINGITFSRDTDPKFNSNKYQATYTFPEQGGTIALTKDIPSVVNNLTSTSTTDSLSAAQGKVLNDKFASYLPLSGGTITGDIVPDKDMTYDLGSRAKMFSVIYADEFNSNLIYTTDVNANKVYTEDGVQINNAVTLEYDTAKKALKFVF